MLQLPVRFGAIGAPSGGLLGALLGAAKATAKNPPNPALNTQGLRRV